MQATRTQKAASVLGVLALAGVLTVAIVPALRARAFKLVRPREDIAARVAAYGPSARQRMLAGFARAGVAYPPGHVTLLGLKRERRLEVHAPDAGGAMRPVLSYPILAASGSPGPKLRRGDGQVPEGAYRVESLNPNSLYHLALRVGYPSDADRARAIEDGREQLGGDIMIHGGAGSVGCLAMGDAAAEELFVLAADVGVERVDILLSPVDFRRPDARVDTQGMPAWVAGRYAEIRVRMQALPRQ